MENKKYVYTVDEIKDILGIGRRQAYDLVKAGEFPIKRIGTRILIPVKTFDDWIQGQ